MKNSQTLAAERLRALEKLDKERKKLDRQIETIQGQYRQALEAEEKEAGYGR